MVAAPCQVVRQIMALGQEKSRLGGVDDLALTWVTIAPVKRRGALHATRDGSMATDEITRWLLDGDPAIRWQTQRDLLGKAPGAYRAARQRVTTEGWGARLLALQDPTGAWGGGLYTPKWISTTYTMLLLRHLGLPPDHAQARTACNALIDRGFYRDGGINFFKSLKHSETCVTGMILSLLSCFLYLYYRTHRIVDHLLGQQMPDGGWNCERPNGATHGSFHTTLSLLA